VHVRSGSGATDDGVTSGGALTGLGNLVVGYNETTYAAPRTGSHNLVVGWEHGYTSAGGFVAGEMNQVRGFASSVSGGFGSVASGHHASVSGGESNLASGRGASVSGGSDRSALGDFDWAAGGLFEDQ